MAIAISDRLLFENSNMAGVVIGGDAVAGWQTLIENLEGQVPVISDAAALAAQATSVAAPAGRPAVGDPVSIFQSRVPSNQPTAWRVEGYFTTTGIGAAVQALLQDIDMPSRKCFVDASLLFAA